MIIFFSYSFVAVILLKGEFELTNWYSILLRPDTGLWFFYVEFFISTYVVLINILNNMLLNKKRGWSNNKYIDIWLVIEVLVVLVTLSAVAVYTKKVQNLNYYYNSSLFAIHIIFYTSGLLIKERFNQIKHFLTK